MGYARRTSTGGGGLFFPISKGFSETFDLVNEPGADFLSLSLSLSDPTLGVEFGTTGLVVTVWSKGLISLGVATDAQRNFMNAYAGSNIAQFPGAFVAIGGSATEYSTITFLGNRSTIEIRWGGVVGSIIIDPDDLSITSTAGSTGVEVAAKLGDGSLIIGAVTSGYSYHDINVIRGSFTGDDTIVGGDVIQTIKGFLGNDSLTGGSTLDKLQGAAGNDRLFGGGGDDILEGGADSDLLDGGSGRDILIGGTGDDTYVSPSFDDTIVELDGEGTDTVLVAEDYFLPSQASIEILRATGTAPIQLSGNELANRIEGNDAANRLFGGGGSDDLRGGGGNDFLDGGAGDDLIDGGAGIDQVAIQLASGASGVTFQFRDAGGVIQTGFGTDTLISVESAEITGTSLGDTITGGSFGDRLLGAGGNDTLSGSGGDDFIDGGLGDDTIDGGAGIDTLLVDFGLVTVAARTYVFTPGTGIVATGIPNLNIPGYGFDSYVSIEAVDVRGTTFGDSLTGGAFADRLSGLGGNDTLIGLDGDDILEGGAAEQAVANTSFQTALLLDGSFGLQPSAAIDNATTIPHVTVAATGADHLNYYKFTVPLPGSTAVFDIDGARLADGTTFDTFVVLYNSAGERVDFNDDSVPDPGSMTSLDSFLSYTFAVSGTYFLVVGGYAGSNGVPEAISAVPTGASYTLNVSLSTASVGSRSLIGNRLEGGRGNDTYIVISGGDQIVELANEGTDTVQTTVDFTLAPGSFVERLVAADPLASTGLVLTGNAIANQIVGNAGPNVLSGGAGNDELQGLDGDDIYIVDDPGDRVIEGTGGGSDEIRATVSFAAPANVERITVLDPLSTASIALTGNALDNVITGGAGRDRLDGGSGTDTLIGGGGIDTAVLDYSDFVVSIGVPGTNPGVNLDLFGTLATFDTSLGRKLLNGIEAYRVIGTVFNDTIAGNSYDDYIAGGPGNDILIGRGGNDTLVGGAGADVLDGGTGFDRADYFGETEAVTIDLRAGTALAASGNDMLFSVEDALGGSGNDTLRAGAVASVSGTDLIKTNQSIGFVGFALDLDDYFSLVADPEIEDSTTIAHATVIGTGSGNFDYYGFTVIEAGSFVTIDIDHADFDTEVRIFNELGEVIGENDDFGTIDPGGTSSLESFLRVRIDEPGRYYIQVYRFNEMAITQGLQYTLNVSVENYSDFRLDGGPGNDRLISGSGNDRIEGGSGSDTVSYAEASGAVSINLALGTATGNGIDKLSGVENIEGSPFADQLVGDVGPNTLDGGAGANSLDGGGGDDLFRLERGANDTALGGAGNDAFYFGEVFTAGDSVDGGAGIRDQIGLQGNYAGGVTFGNNVTGIEQVILLPGNDTRFGDVSGAFYSYAITTGNAAIAAGQQMVFQANILRSGENFTLDASGETDGSVFTYGGQGNDALTGSQGSDAFFFGTARFGAGDVVNGQGGALDSLGLQGNYAGGSAVSFGAGQLIGVEQLVFLSNSDTRFGGAGSGTPYNYTITTHDGNVAAGTRMIIQANTLVSDEVLNFNGSAELDGVFSIFSGNGADTLRGGAGNDTISGRGGADMLFGGGGNDTFLYTNLTDSTPGARDTFGDFSTGDLIDLSRLDAITGGANDAFSFIGNAAFSNTAGQLRAVNTGGNHWLVEADTNGDSIADFALFLTVSDNHPITVSDFLP